MAMTPAERAARVKVLMEECGMSRQQANFAAALEAGDITGDASIDGVADPPPLTSASDTPRP